MVAAAQALHHVLGHLLQSVNTCVADQLGSVPVVMQSTLAAYTPVQVRLALTCLGTCALQATYCV